MYMYILYQNIRIVLSDICYFSNNICSSHIADIIWNIIYVRKDRNAYIFFFYGMKDMLAEALIFWIYPIAMDKDGRCPQRILALIA